MLTLIATGWPYLATLATLCGITGAAYALTPRPDRDERLRTLAAQERAKVARAVAERQEAERFDQAFVEIVLDFGGEEAA